MGKRHQASRRRAYGRRQHEVRERSERPARERFDAMGIEILEIDSFDTLVLEHVGGREPTTAPRAVLRAAAD